MIRCRAAKGSWVLKWQSSAGSASENAAHAKAQRWRRQRVRQGVEADRVESQGVGVAQVARDSSTQQICNVPDMTLSARDMAMDKTSRNSALTELPV